MKHFKLVLVSAATLISIISCIKDNEETYKEYVHPGDKVPVFSCVLNTGDTINTGNLQEGLVIIFFNTSCSDCQRELPILNDCYLRGELPHINSRSGSEDLRALNERSICEELTHKNNQNSNEEFPDDHFLESSLEEISLQPHFSPLFSLVSSFIPFRYVCISREEDSLSVTKFWNAHNLSMPFSAQTDRKIFSLFASAGIPRVYVVNKNGIVSAQY